MVCADVGKVRNVMKKHIGSRVVVRCNLGRHKVDVTEGVITETYPSIFLVRVKNEAENSFQTVSYSYTDVLTRTVEVEVFDGVGYSPLIPPYQKEKSKRGRKVQLENVNIQTA